jgi:hypothetical protein
MGYVYALMDRWDFYIYYFLTLIAVTLVGLTVAICGWAGARAGMVLSLLVGLLGVGCLFLLLISVYWIWWICVPAIYLGWLGFHSWRRRTEAQRRLPMNFSLSAMFLFVLVVAMVAGGFTIDRRGQKFDDELVEQLARHTGSRVDRVNFGRTSDVTIGPQDEAELREIVAILKQFSALRAVAFMGGANLPPAQTVAILSEMTNLRSLSLQDVPVNDADLLPLAKLKHLEQLELQARTLTDAGLPNLYPLKRLRNLWLYNTDPMLVTPDGMEKLHDALPHWEN